MTLRILIVDDEPLARERIRSLLQGEPEIEIVAECANGQQAVQAVEAHRPGLMFLDVQMPEMGGFEVLRAIPPERLPLVIFVTAYDQHALKAFEVHALDYLLKPFKQSRFKQALSHAREVLAQRGGAGVSRELLALLEQVRPGPGWLVRIPVREGERVQFIKTSQIEYIESAGNYVVLHAGKANHVVRETLTALETRLNPRQFLRISRSALVNMDQIKEVQPLFKGEHAVRLHNGKQLTMTRGLREVQRLLKFA
ncbi:MAG TPA: LytTR family DNA-binding domain-containing protein [Verrucomicrobiae bacterium]|nr:LytTR family DNA-binding domain-containing protein [Verrucomicrobiae bacterium]